MTIGRNIFDYGVTTKEPIVDLTTTKLLLTSVISTPGATFMTIDMKKIYLKTELKKKQSMLLPADLMPEEIRTHCNSHDKIHHG